MRASVLLVFFAAARLATADTTAPIIEHTPPVSGTKGTSLVLSVRIVDESEIFLPAIHLRKAGSSAWKPHDLRARNGSFFYELQLEEDVEYWLEAYDEYGNGPGLSGSAQKPHLIRALAPVARAESPAPVVEEFDQEPPSIEHSPPGPQPPGGPLTLSARITDASGVFAPMLYLLEQNSTGPLAHELSLSAENVYSLTVTPQASFSYWIEAYDNMGNGPSSSGTKEAPHLVRIEALSPPLAALVEPAPVEVSKPSLFERVPRQWWIRGGIGAVGAALVGVAVYSIASSGPDSEYFVISRPSRR